MAAHRRLEGPLSSDVVTLLVVLGSGLGVLPLLAHRLTGAYRRKACGWLLLAALQATALRLCEPWGGWGRLCATWAATFVGFKALILLHAPPARLAGLTWGRYVGWAFGWLGMDLEPWMRPRGPRWTPGAWRTLTEGAVFIALGIVVVLGFARAPFPTGARLVQAWGVAAGLLVSIFFGFTRLLTAGWRAAGREVPPLFVRPLQARSLSDWWGRRWNLSVHTVLLETIWRPLRGRLGGANATTAVFLASGLLHEYLISYPARGGYGGPLLYFTLQAIGLRLERTTRLRALLRRPGAAAALWTLGVVLGPAWLLFHPPLLRALVTPWLR